MTPRDYTQMHRIVDSNGNTVANYKGTATFDAACKTAAEWGCGEYMVVTEYFD